MYTIFSLKLSYLSHIIAYRRMLAHKLIPLKFIPYVPFKVIFLASPPITLSRLSFLFLVFSPFASFVPNNLI